MKKKLVTILGILFLLALFFYEENNLLVTTELTIVNAKFPKELNELTIIHISDLHNKSFGNKQKRLIKKIINQDPDFIVITGDLIDRKTKEFQNSMDLIENLVTDFTVYYVTGNHEWGNKDFSKLKAYLIESSVTVLNNEYVFYEKNDAKIKIFGIDDPNSGIVFEETLMQLAQQKTTVEFTLLLSHRPEMFEEYVKNNFDIVFSGHAHGGQFRIPFIGGVIAPGQGFFPKYTSGMHQKENTTMVVSRGLGNSIIPQRIFNHPEIVVVKIQSEEHHND